MRTNNKRRNILRRYGCLVMTLLGIGGIVNAQTLQTSENDTIVKLEDVVVSSLKVEKKVAEAPVSITIVDAMKYCLVKKYEWCPEFREALERTKGLYIVEDQTTFPRKTADSWGVKLSADGTQYVGPNLLGRLLMELRDNGGKLEYRLPEEMTRFVDLTQH